MYTNVILKSSYSSFLNEDFTRGKMIFLRSYRYDEASSCSLKWPVIQKNPCLETCDPELFFRETIFGSRNDFWVAYIFFFLNSWFSLNIRFKKHLKMFTAPTRQKVSIFFSPVATLLIFYEANKATTLPFPLKFVFVVNLITAISAPLGRSWLHEKHEWRNILSTL